MIKRMEPERLKQFIREFIAGRVYTSDDIREPTKEAWGDSVSRVFLPVMFGCLNDIPLEVLNAELGVLWSYWDEALPRGCNGRPMFMKCRLMHNDDWTEVQRVAKETGQAMEDSMGVAGE